MRLLLIQPPPGTSLGFARILTGEPLGLECIGGAVQSRGHEAVLVDLRLDDWQALERHLDEPPAAVGVSCSFSTDVYGTHEIARYIKERRPEVPVVVGGHHATLLPEDFLWPGSSVDAVAIGEGEGTSIDLMDALRDGSGIDAVAGLLTRSNWSAGFSRRPLSVSLDAWPGPDRALTRRYRHRYHHGLSTRSATLEMTRGCPFDCNFCSIWVFYQRRVSKRSPAAIVEELGKMSEPYVFVADDLAFLDRAGYRETAERLVASGIRKKYCCQTRSDLILRNRDLLPLWKAAGMADVFLGTEKIDDEGLAFLRKRTRGGAHANRDAIQVLRDNGITPMTMFIADPDWDERDFDRLEEFISELALPNPGFTVLTPLPGTALYDEHAQRLVTRDYGYYDVIHAVLPTRLPLERFYERLAGLYDYVSRQIRPSWAMLRRSLELACDGQLWCMRKLHSAIREMRDPSAYLRPPVRIRAPLRRRLPPERARSGMRGPMHRSR
jgi:radical SAM superfamily enzyme YgiQ (UPF0313 family)